MNTNKVSPEPPILLVFFAAALITFWTTPVCLAGGTPATGAASDQLVMMGGADAPAANGDAITASDGLDTVYYFYIEVPAGQTNLEVDLFDADVLANASDEAQERDRPRGNERTSVRYQLFDPAGNLVASRFNYGDDNNPPSAHGAWKAFYDNTTAGISGGDTFSDTFGTNAYTNNNGTVNFAGNWTEVNDLGGGGATGGNIQVTGGVLRIHNQSDVSPFTNQPSIFREANLSSYAAATVSFDWTSGSGVDALAAAASAGDSIAFEVSSNGGTNYTVLEEFADLSGVMSGSRTYDVTDFIASNTRFRFRITMRYAGVNEFIDIDNFLVRGRTSANGAGPANGHWQLRVDMTNAVNADQDRLASLRDDVNAFGIRAHDGDPTSGGTEFNVYAESFFIAGVNRNNGARDYQLFPWVNAGCQIDEHDFDYDADLAPEGGLNPNVQPYGDWTLTSRTGSFTDTSTTMSSNNSWTSQAVVDWTSFNQAADYGIWTWDIRIEDNGPGNYAPLYLTYDLDVGEPPPTSNPENGAFRLYLPNDAGTAPAKPYLQQYLTHVASMGPNPPQVGVTSRFAVTVAVHNPTGSAGSISFSNTNVVTTRVPGGTVVYAGLAFTSQGSLVAAPTIGGSGDVTWNPGTVTTGTTATLVYLIDVTPVAAVDILASGAFASGNGTRATYIDETGNSSQSRALTSLGELCELTIDADTPTPALISSFVAKGAPEGRLLEWWTAAEAGTLSFDLYRLEGEKSLRLNAEPLLALVDAPQGGRYQFLERSAPASGSARYLLAENDSRGQRRSHGPFVVAEGRPAATLPPGDFRREAKNPPALDRARRRDAARAAAVPPATLAADKNRGAAVYKIAISEAGFYQVPLSQLATLFGISTAEVRTRLAEGRFDLRRQQNPVAWTAWGATAGAAPGIETSGLAFWAEPAESPFYTASVYWLRLGEGRTIGSRQGQTPPATGAPSTSRDLLVAEREVRPLVLMSLDPDGDFFFWDYLAPGGAQASRDFTIELPSLSPNAGSAELLLDFQGAASGTHLLSASLNGSPLGDFTVDGKNRLAQQLSLPAGLLRSGTNTLNLRSLGGSLVFFDHLEIRFDRQLKANGNFLLARFGSSRFGSATHFSSPEAAIFDLAEKDRPWRLSRAKSRGELGGGFRLDFENGRAGDRFVALTAAALKPVPTPVPDQPSNLRAAENTADFLVIAPAGFSTAAQRLANYRERRGLESRVVELEDIYDEFADGHRDARAIRTFLAHALGHWQKAPRYVLLAGAGSYDWRDNLGYGDNLVPMLMVDRGGSLFPSDARFADLRGNDGIPELAIGRVPALSADELTAYLDKLEVYESSGSSPQNEVLLLADGTDSRFDFAAESRRFASLLPRGFHTEVLALAEKPSLAAARSELFGALAEGRAWLTYVGHGGVDRLSSQGLLTKADVPGLPNAGKLFVLQAISCHVGLHGLPGFDALGEDLVIDPAAGAVAVVAPAWLSEHDEAKRLGDRLLRQVFQQRQPRLGDALLEAMASAGDGGVPADLLGAYQLLGDPTLEIRIEDEPGPVPPSCAPDCGAG